MDLTSGQVAHGIRPELAQRSGITPDGVQIHRLDIYRPAGGISIIQHARKCHTPGRRLHPALTDNPLQIRTVLGVPFDRRSNVVQRLTWKEIHLALGEGKVQKVHVAVDEARDDDVAVQVDLFLPGSLGFESGWIGLWADVVDSRSFDNHGFLEGSHICGGGGRENAGICEDGDGCFHFVLYISIIERAIELLDWNRKRIALYL